MASRPPLNIAHNGGDAFVLHKGFYDLLALTSPSRLFQWGSHPPPPLRKITRISKDMVSNPTGFVYVSHDPLRSLVTSPLGTSYTLRMPTRQRPFSLDGVQTGWESSVVCFSTLLLLPFFTPPTPDPRWATPIKSRVRHTNRAKAINEVVNALKPSATSAPDAQSPPLRVVNGLSTPTSSTLTTAAQENIPVSSLVDGLPGRPGNSTIRWTTGLIPHPEVGEHEDGLPVESRNLLPSLVQSQRKPITPSLPTLEKAVSARIYFENLYFPLLRQPPSREQRRVAMERDMIAMNLSEEQKGQLRARWRQNETDHLRDRRRKVDVTTFIKLKTIGHGSCYR